MNSAVVSGVPQLLVPSELDAPYLSRRIADVQAGEWISPDSVDGDSIRDRVGALVAEERYQKGADQLRWEALAQPSPNEFVGILEDAVHRHLM